MSNEEIASKIIDTFKRGNKVLIIGNGGSAAEASHFAAEFICRFKRDRQSLPALSLTNEANITAISNDYGYSKVFSRQIEGIGKERDLLITLSTSGESENIRHGIKQAQAQGINVISFPTNYQLGTETAKTQETHLAMIHEISRIVENEFI